MIVVSLMLSSCGSMPKDNSLSPVDAGLYVLEMRSSCGYDVGLHGCHFNSQTNLEEKFVQFPVAFKGEWEIVSDRCNFSSKQTFDGQSWVTFSWAELLKNRNQSAVACLFSMRVKIDGVRSLMGQFLLEDNEEFESAKIRIFDRNYVGVAYFQLKKSSSLDSFVELEAQEVEFEGCGASGVEQSNKVLLSKLFPDRKSCLMALGGVSDTFSIGTLNIKFYDDKFVDLPMPKISYKNGKLSIEADEIVGVVAINDRWKKSNKMSLKVKSSETVFVRLLTSNGRFLVIGVQNGRVVWTSSKK